MREDRKTTELRRQNMRKIATYLGNQALFAEKLGKVNSQIYDIIGKTPKRGATDSFVDFVEEVFGLPRNSLDDPNFEYPYQSANLDNVSAHASSDIAQNSTAKMEEADLSQQVALLQKLKQLIENLGVKDYLKLAEKAGVSRTEIDNFIETKLISFDSLVKVMERKGATHLMKGNFPMLPRTWKEEYVGMYFDPKIKWVEPDKSLKDLEEAFDHIS